MTDTIVKFPNSKRVLTPDEERLVKSCSNLIHSTYEHGNKFVKLEQKSRFYRKSNTNSVKKSI